MFLPDYVFKMIPEEIREKMEEDMLGLVKADFTIELKKFYALPQNIINEVWEYCTIPKEIRLEMINALEECTNKELSAEMMESLKKENAIRKLINIAKYLIQLFCKKASFR